MAAVGLPIDTLGGAAPMAYRILGIDQTYATAVIRATEVMTPDPEHAEPPGNS